MSVLGAKAVVESKLVLEPGETCDRCSVAAKLKVRLADSEDGHVLAFCGHHAHEYADHLAKLATDYVTAPDFTWDATKLPA